MKIAALQMVSTPRVDANLAAMRRLVARPAAAGARLVALPEYFCFMGADDRDKLALAEAAGDGPIQQALAQAARTHCAVADRRHAADALRRRQPEQVMNASCVYAPDGRPGPHATTRCTCSATTTDASATTRPAVLRAGSAPVAFDVDGLPVGLSVCYDLRLPRAVPTPRARATCSRCRRPSPTPPAALTGSCCCARGRSRTSAT
jgi:nitrilase